MNAHPAPSHTLAGQTAVVTGGASGIGRATCLALAELGANVVVADRNVEQAAHVAEQIGDAQALALPCDVTDEQQLAALVDTTLAKFDRLDILVHSAGVLRAKDSAPMALAQLSVEEFDFVVNTNLKGTFLCNRAVLPAMFRQKSGQIINVASTSGRKARPLDSAYSASKFGVVGLTESLAEEVRSFGIRVQLVLPDAVDTPLWDQNGPVPAPEWSLPPERVAETIAYLLCLPPDMVLGEVSIHPVRTRRRRKRGGSAPAES